MIDASSRADAHPGSEHLPHLACEAREAGGPGEGRARDYAARVLRDAGFDVRLEPFTFSAVPGRYATPIGGVIGALAILGTAYTGLSSPIAWHAAVVLATGLGALTLFVHVMLGDAVLDVPLARATSWNLVATRGAAESPRVWLVAHLDSKSQPVPSAVRVAGIALLVAAIVVAVVTALGALLQPPAGLVRTGWWAATVLVGAGSPAVMASVVGHVSDGAVDNASGVASVLLAASRVGPAVPLGVLLSSAEELGLAGARAFVRARRHLTTPGLALNCDGVDDEGTMTIMYGGPRPESLITTMQRVATAPLRVRRLPVGLLTDSVAFVDRGWASVTVSRGGWHTLRRIHSRGDTLRALRGTGIESAATLLARAAEALA